MALAAKPVFRRHPEFLESYFARIRRVLTQFAFNTADAITRLRRLDDEAADASLALSEIGSGKYQRNVGVLARGDVLLCSVEHVGPSAMFGTRADDSGVRTALRFGETERAQQFAACHRPQVSLLLLRCAVFDQRHAANRIVAAHDRRDRSIAGRNLLQRDCVGDIVCAHAIPFGRDGHSHEAKRAQLPKRITRKFRLPIPFGRKRG